jgi:hypothetical protein
MRGGGVSRAEIVDQSSGLMLSEYILGYNKAGEYRLLI